MAAREAARSQIVVHVVYPANGPGDGGGEAQGSNSSKVIAVADLRVQFHGPLTVWRDEAAVRLRTRQQALLLARLVAHFPSPIDRPQTAGLLWPDADRGNALAYLRRAVKELRETGISISSEASRLRLEKEIPCDIDGARRTDGGHRFFGADPVLEGVEHPIADEIRAIVRQRSSPLSNGHRRLISPHQSKSDERLALGWFGEKLMRDRPELATKLVCDHWEEFRIANPPGEVLGVLLRLLKSLPSEGSDRGRLLAFAGRTANLLTRRSQALKLLHEALDHAETQGDLAMSALVYTELMLVSMDVQDWAPAKTYGRLAIDAADRSGDLLRMVAARHVAASMQWHTLDFDSAAKNYRQAWLLSEGTSAEESERLLARTNLALLWAIFGIQVDPAVEPFETYEYAHGYGGGVESYLQFATGFGYGDLATAAEGMLRLLDVTSKEQMDSFFAMALDGAAFLFSRLLLPTDAAACVRIGTWLRLQTLQRRTPAEKLAVRSHVRPPFFGPSISRLVGEWMSNDLDQTAQQIAARIRAA